MRKKRDIIDILIAKINSVFWDKKKEEEGNLSRVAPGDHLVKKWIALAENKGLIGVHLKNTLRSLKFDMECQDSVKIEADIDITLPYEGYNVSIRNSVATAGDENTKMQIDVSFDDGECYSLSAVKKGKKVLWEINDHS